MYLSFIKHLLRGQFVKKLPYLGIIWKSSLDTWDFNRQWLGHTALEYSWRKWWWIVTVMAENGFVLWLFYRFYRLYYLLVWLDCFYSSLVYINTWRRIFVTELNVINWNARNCKVAIHLDLVDIWVFKHLTHGCYYKLL